MVFYKYTISKMFKSISTYTTAVFGVFPTLLLGILAMANIGVGYEYTSVIAVATFPLFVVFITFKVVQVFRDEIENQTMLTIVSKPIPRKRLVAEGLLSVFTMICILSFIGIFIPMFGYLRTEPDAGEVILKALLVMLTTILLGSIVGALGMLLSLSMKGKSFIGVMIAIFGVGFYALWGGMTGLRVATSRNAKLTNFATKAHIVGEKDDGGMVSDIQRNGEWVTYTITPDQYAVYADGKTPVENAHEIYEDFIGLADFKVMDFVKWIDPSLHWQVLYNGAASVGDGPKTSFGIITSGADLNVEIDADETKPIDESAGKFQVRARIKTESAIPIYYPILLWLVIGGLVVGLSFRTLSKSNIS